MLIEMFHRKGDATMKSPIDYKSDFSLYKAISKITENSPTVSQAVWLRNALEECRENRKELFELIKNTLFSKKWTIDNLISCKKTYYASA